MSGNGTGSFIRQRLTGVVMIPLTVFLIWLVVSLAGKDRAEMVGAFSNPVVWILTLIMLGAILVHMRIGMQEVIEDYIHDPRLHALCSTLNTGFAVIVGLLAAVSTLVLAFGG